MMFEVIENAHVRIEVFHSLKATDLLDLPGGRQRDLHMPPNTAFRINQALSMIR